jgi:hypothetical protein
LSVFAYAVGTYRDVPDPRRLLNFWVSVLNRDAAGGTAAPGPA